VGCRVNGRGWLEKGTGGGGWQVEAGCQAGARGPSISPLSAMLFATVIVRRSCRRLPAPRFFVLHRSCRKHRRHGTALPPPPPALPPPRRTRVARPLPPRHAAARRPQQRTPAQPKGLPPVSGSSAAACHRKEVGRPEVEMWVVRAWEPVGQVPGTSHSCFAARLPDAPAACQEAAG